MYKLLNWINIDILNWDNLSLNENAINLLSLNKDKNNWDLISLNKSIFSINIMT